MVCLPVFISILLGASETLQPAYVHWKEQRENNPAFPPSAVDYFLRGQDTSMPGHENLTRAMPKHVSDHVEAAEEDLHAEEIADSVNGNLHHVVEEAKHFASVM